MANNTIDTLSIQITSSSAGATRAIGNLIGGLEKLNGALESYAGESNKYTRAMANITTGLENLSRAVNGVDANNLKSVADSIRSLSSAGKSLGNIFNNTGLNKAAKDAEAMGRAVDNALGGMKSNEANVNPFSQAASGLKQLQGITLPNMSGIKDFTQAIAMMGHKNVLQGVARIPVLAQSLKVLSNISIPEMPNIKPLAELIQTFNRLGSKSGNAAAANIRPMINGLQQLSSLTGLAFPESSGLMDLANAFSAMGRVTSGRAVENIPKLADAFFQLMNTLSHAPEVSENVIRLAEAFGKLASYGGKLPDRLKQIENIIMSIHQKSKAVSGRIFEFGKSLVQSGKHAMSAGDRFNNLASKIGLLYAKFWLLLRVIRVFNKAIDIASHLTEIQNVIDTTFGNAAYKVEEFSKNAIKNFGLSELAAKQLASRFQAMGTAMGITGQQVAKAQQLINTKRTADGLVAGYNEASNSMADMSINLTKLAADMASFYDIEQETVGKALQSGVMAGQTRPLRQYGIDLTNATLSEWAMNNGLNANIKSMTQAEKAMLRYQYVMAQTTNAQGDFTRTAKTWHNSVVVLKQQLMALAAVIGSGLIQALKPFVNAMNNALSGLITFAQNVVNALGKIFGWEMEVSTSGLAMDEDAYDIDTSGLEDVADAAGDAGKATDGAAKSAKKLKEQLQGFDKLNVIRSQDNSDAGGGSGGSGGGGGGGAGGGGGGGVSGGDVSASLKKTKGMFESDIDSLYELGAYINDTLYKALKDIKWEDVYKAADNFGTGLASFLNGLVDDPKLFRVIGETVAGCINTALHFLDSFGKTFHWDKFGASLAAGLNGFLGKMQWSTALSASKNWGAGIGKTLAGFIKEADFAEVGRAVGNFIKTQVVFFLSLGSEIPWADLGTKLAETINGAIETFPASELAETINVWVQGLWDLFVNMVKNVDKEKLIAKIKEFIGALDFKTIAIVIGGLSLVKGAALTISIASAIVSAVAQQFVTLLAKQIAIKMAGSTLLSGAIGGGLGQAAQKAMGSGTLVGQVSSSSGSIIKSLTGIGVTIGGLGLTSQGFYKTWNEGWSASSGAMTVAGTAISIAGLGIAGVLTGPLALAIAGTTAAFSFFAANHEKILGGMSKKWDEFKGSCKQFGKDVSDAFTGVDRTSTATGKKYKETSTKMVNITGDMGKNIKKNVDTMKKNTTSSFSKMGTESKGKVDVLKKGVSKNWADMQATAADKIGGKKNSILSTAKTSFGKVSSEGSSKAGEIKGKVSGVWTSVGNNATKQIAGNGKDSVKNKVGSAFDSVKKEVNKKLPINVGKVVSGVELPKITVSKGESHGVDYPKFSMKYQTYAKAYDTPWMFNQSTLVPDLHGAKMFGDRQGGEMVYGHENLMNDIREASGTSQMTDIGNRQLANDQRIIRLLTVIAEKEFGVTSRDVFNAVRSEATNYNMRTGRNAFEY